MKDFKNIELNELYALSKEISKEIKERLLNSDCIDILTQIAFEECFYMRSGKISCPITVNTDNNIIALGGLISGNHISHKCSLYTINKDGEEFWCWDDSNHEIMLKSKISKMNNNQYSVCLITAEPGLILTRHEMEYKSGKGHKRINSTSWNVIIDDENVFDFELNQKHKISKLPYIKHD